jgi:hypothetical protein
VRAGAARVIRAFAKERITNAVDEIADRRKVDRDLVGETFVRPIVVARYSQFPLTIEVGGTLVKAAYEC